MTDRCAVSLLWSEYLERNDRLDNQNLVFQRAVSLSCWFLLKSLPVDVFIMPALNSFCNTGMEPSDHLKRLLSLVAGMGSLVLYFLNPFLCFLGANLSFPFFKRGTSGFLFQPPIMSLRLLISFPSSLGSFVLSPLQHYFPLSLAFPNE